VSLVRVDYFPWLGNRWTFCTGEPRRGPCEPSCSASVSDSSLVLSSDASLVSLVALSVSSLIPALTAFYGSGLLIVPGTLLLAFSVNHTNFNRSAISFYS
jgi:hypothetical protein